MDKEGFIIMIIVVIFITSLIGAIAHDKYQDNLTIRTCLVKYALVECDAFR